MRCFSFLFPLSFFFALRVLGAGSAAEAREEKERGTLLIRKLYYEALTVSHGAKDKRTDSSKK